MSEIRTPRTPRSTRTTKSLEALSATLNRALTAARAPQVTAARRTDTRGTARAAAARTDTLAARRRTNLLIGTLDRLRAPATSRRAGHGTPTA